MILLCQQVMSLTDEEMRLEDLGINPSPVHGRITINLTEITCSMEEIDDEGVATGNTQLFMQDSPSALIKMDYDSFLKTYVEFLQSQGITVHGLSEE